MRLAHLIHGDLRLAMDGGCITGNADQLAIRFRTARNGLRDRLRALAGNLLALGTFNRTSTPVQLWAVVLGLCGECLLFSIRGQPLVRWPAGLAAVGWAAGRVCGLLCCLAAAWLPSFRS